MSKRRVNQLFLILNPSEQEDFLRWLSYKLGETQRYVSLMALSLFRNPQATPEEIWQDLYPAQRFDDARQRKLSRDLSAWLEKYLTVIQLEKDTHSSQYLLLEALESRNEQELFDRYWQKFHRTETRQPIRNVAHFHHQLRMKQQQLRHHARFDPKTYQREIPQLSYHLDQWWMLYKLQLACLNALYSQMYGELPEEMMLSELLAFLDQEEEYLDSPLATIYVQLFALLKGDDIDEGKNPLTMLNAHRDALSAQDRQNIFNLLLSHHIGKLNALGGQEQLQQLFELYQWGIETRILLTDGQISSNQYFNILAVSLRAGKHEAALASLEELKPYLPDMEMDPVYKLGKGIYHFAKKEFREVLDILMPTRFSQIFREIQARVLLLQAQYECYGAEDEWLHNQLDSFIRYLRGKKLSSGHKQAYLNRFKLFKRLVLVHTREDLDKLSRLIEETHPLDNPAWLKEKVAERQAAGF